MRCDICLQPILRPFKSKHYHSLGDVQCCSETCSKFLFSGCKESFVHRRKSEGEKFERELMHGWFSTEDPRCPGLKTTVQYSICQATKEVLSLSGIAIKVWHRNIYKPTCIEYTIDEDFNATKVLKIEGTTASFSDEETKEMMIQLHKAIVLAGVPYSLNLNLMGN